MSIGTDGKYGPVSSTMMEEQRLQWILRSLVAPALLALAVWLVFGPARHFDFTNYDERLQLLENPHVQGLTFANIRWIFTHYSITSYYPVRALTLAADYSIWGGPDPHGYHLTNVLLHLANTLLVYALVGRLVRRSETIGRDCLATTLTATVAAGLFALHPVVVEPVAWVAGREELLMVFFTLACVHFVMSAASESGKRRFVHAALATVCCACACMSNAVAAIVPAIVVAYWFSVERVRSAVSLAIRTWPFWLLGISTVILKLISEHHAVVELEMVPPPSMTLFERGLTVLDVFWHNISNLFWPDALWLLYSTEIATSLNQPRVWYGLIAAVMTGVVLIATWRHRLMRFGLLWFLLALAPSAQLQPHHIFNADRFCYLPLVGLSLFAAVAMMRWLRSRVAVAVVAGVLLALLTYRTCAQVPLWKNTATIFNHTVQQNPDQPIAYVNRGSYYYAHGDYARALQDFNRAIALRPTYADAWSNRGSVYVAMGDYETGLRNLNEAIRLYPRHPEGYWNRAMAYLRMGRYEAAAADYTQLIAWNIDTTRALNNRGRIYEHLGDLEKALADFNAALARQPDYDFALMGRGTVYLRMGRLDAAIADLERAAKLQSDPQTTLVRLVVAYTQAGRRETAQRTMDRLAAATDDPFGTQIDLAEWFLRCKNVASAIEHYRQALAIRPDAIKPMTRLAWLLATASQDSLRNGPEAVRLATEACRVTNAGDANALAVLAGAYAEVGRFDDAVDSARKALAIARDAGDAKLAEILVERIELYRSHHPYREPP